MGKEVLPPRCQEIDDFDSLLEDSHIPISITERSDEAKWLKQPTQHEESPFAISSGGSIKDIKVYKMKPASPGQDSSQDFQELLGDLSKINNNDTSSIKPPSLDLTYLNTAPTKLQEIKPKENSGNEPYNNFNSSSEPSPTVV